MSISDLKAVKSDPKMPECADVVVVGAGIVGVSTAYNLARRGLRVALLDKGRVGAEQSSRNWGWCRQQNRDEREIPLIIKSLALWEGMATEIGADAGFCKSGLSFVTDNEADLALWDGWNRMASQYGVPSRTLSAREAQAVTPGCNTNWIGGTICTTDGSAEPGLAAPLIAEAARRHGTTIHQDCAARGIETSAGRVSGVITERGLIRAQAVVCAGGSWTSRFCAHHGIDLPQANVRGTAFRTSAAPGIIKIPLYTPQFTIRPRLDGGYTVALNGRGRLEITPRGLKYTLRFLPLLRLRFKGLNFALGRSFFEGPDAVGDWRDDEVSPFERTRVLDPWPDPAIVSEGIAALRAAYPSLGDLRVAQSWAGAIDSTPDAIPVISPIDKLPGLIVSAGYSGHGFGIGPAAGRLTADLVTGDTPIVDPVPYRYSRFFDGSGGKAPKLF